MSELKLPEFFKQTLEYSRIMGQPVDPVNRFAPLVQKLTNGAARVEVVDNAHDYVYVHSVNKPDYKVTTITADGVLTTISTSLIAPAIVTFTDVTSPEYLIGLMDMARRKEDVIARVKAAIEQSMDAKEIQMLLALLDSAATTVGLTSGQTRFQMPNLSTMLNNVMDYGTEYKLFANKNIWKDIVDSNFNDNKFVDVYKTLETWKVSFERIPDQTLATNGAGATPLIATDVAYLVAQDSNSSVDKSPLLLLRASLDDINQLGGAILEKGGQPERLILVSPTPTSVSSQRIANFGCTGIEQIVAINTNSYAISKFSK